MADRIVADHANLMDEVREQRRLCDLAMQEHEVDKAKRDALAEEKKDLKARVEQLEGNILSLQGEVAARDSEVIRIQDFIRQAQ